MFFSRLTLTACFVAFAAAQLIALHPARADVIILPDDDLSPIDSSGGIHVRRQPNTPVDAMGFHAVVPDFATGGAETVLDATYTWTLAPTTAAQDYIDPSGTTTEDTTYFTAAGRANGTTKQFTLSCRVQGTTVDDSPFDETGSISITVVWSNIAVTSIEVDPVVNDPARYDTLSVFHLVFNQHIYGTGLDQCNSRQLIKMGGTALDKTNGNQLASPSFGIPNLNVGPAPGPVFDWTEDWTWGPLPNLNAQHTASQNPDEHTNGAATPWSSTVALVNNNWVVTSASGPLSTRNVVAKIEVKITATNEPIAAHYWGYDWDNWNGRWLTTDTPPATVGWISGGPHWPQVGGEFSNGEGLSGPLPDATFIDTH